MTQKIVVNRCYGGFELSDKAILRYAELSGIKLYRPPENSGDDGSFSKSYYKVPYEEYLIIMNKDKKKHNYTESDKLAFSQYDIKRDDKYLIKVVKEFGKESWGYFSVLEIVKIPDDIKWEIEEYDGMEHISEVHRTW